MCAVLLEPPASPVIVAGSFCDGATARLVNVDVCIDEAGLSMQLDGVETVRWPWSQIQAPWHFPGSRIVTLRRDDAPERLYIAVKDIAAWKGRLDRPSSAAEIRMWCALALTVVGLFVGALYYAPAWSHFISEKSDATVEALQAAHSITAFAKRMAGGKQEKPQYCIAASGVSAIEKLVATLAPKEIQRDYTLVVIDSTQVNAYSFGGGYIGLFSGLIDFVENESELARVLAHEIAHDVEGHAAQSSIEAGLSDTIIALLFNSWIPGLVSEQVEPGYIMSWRSRAAERDADQLAITYLLRAGINPAKAADFDRRLLARYGDDNPYLSTHPTHATRISELEMTQASGRDLLTPTEWASIKNICREKTEEAAALLRRPPN